MNVNDTQPPSDSRLHRFETGVTGLEHITRGGLIAGRTALLSGTSGSGKTILSCEIVHRSITQFDRSAVFITFEESPADVVRNVASLGWDFEKYVEQNQLIIIDASIDRQVVDTTGSYDLSGIIAQIEHAVSIVDAKVVVLDSIGALFHLHDNPGLVRREIHRIADALRSLGVTGLLTAERTEEYGAVSRFNIEEFVSDAVIILRHALSQERVRRTIQIYKMRGAEHYDNEFPLLITRKGILIYALSESELTHDSTSDRISSGNAVLDEMAGGGLFRDSIVLVSGPTGGGKTLLCATFAAEGCLNNQRTLLLGFEESRQQLLRNADSWGIDFAKWESQNLLKIESRYPESLGPDGHLANIKDQIRQFEPTRLVIDSVSAMERIADIRGFREFVIGLTSFVKERQICTLFTCTTPELSGGESITEAHISTITDAIILLRYVEVAGALSRGILIIKMRGSQHQKDVREFRISGDGLTIGNSFKGAANVLVGIPSVGGRARTDLETS